jgi:hypothetical protein
VTAATFLAVVAAGAVGAVARAALSAVVESRWRRDGAGTLVVNLLGAFALGAWLGSAGHLDTVWLWTIGTGLPGRVHDVLHVDGGAAGPLARRRPPGDADRRAPHHDRRPRWSQRSARRGRRLRSGGASPVRDAP